MNRFRRPGSSSAALVVGIAAAAAGVLPSPAAASATSVPEVLITTPYPSVSVEPGSTLKLDLQAFAPRTERVDLAVSACRTAGTPSCGAAGSSSVGSRPRPTPRARPNSNSPFRRRPPPARTPST
ncbi:MAG: hypothetical protein R2705_04825 [Ilumatobacteraceae bacterium]